MFCNLYDGFTVCNLNPYLMKFDVISLENERNITLPVQFIHKGEHVLLGGPHGKVIITGLPHKPTSFQPVTLPHGGRFNPL